MQSQLLSEKISVIIPAAGIGSRMQADVPKQYLKLQDKPIIAHTINKFVDLPFIEHVVVALNPEDDYFHQLPISKHPKIKTVHGGSERADSVLSGIKHAKSLGSKWVMVHDAARPCVLESDIISLAESALSKNVATILGQPVRDTMKRTQQGSHAINETVERANLWHAFTPQCCPIEQLESALLAQVGTDGSLNSAVTDEASALELSRVAVNMIAGSATNIKVTQPEDLVLAEFYLSREKNEY